MAKRRGRPRGSRNKARGWQSPTLESVMERLQAWTTERDALARDLRRIADSLGSAVVHRPPPSLGPLKGVGGATRKRAPMSPEAKARIAAAVKARWARQKAAQQLVGAKKVVKRARKAKSV